MLFHTEELMRERKIFRMNKQADFTLYILVSQNKFILIDFIYSYVFIFASSTSLIVYDKPHYSYERDETLRSHKVNDPD